MDSTKIVFIIFLVFNSLLIVGFITMEVIGGLSLKENSKFHAAIFDEDELLSLKFFGVTFIVIGILALLFALFGFYGVYKESKVIIFIYMIGVFMMFLIILNSSTLMLVFVNMNFNNRHWKESLNKTLSLYEIGDHKEEWDNLQLELSCCGIDKGRRDYTDNMIQIPVSCCRMITDCKGNQTRPDDFFSVGCLTKFENHHECYSIIGIFIALGLLGGSIAAFTYNFYTTDSKKRISLPKALSN